MAAMKSFLEKKRGYKVRIIIELNAQKQPIHVYEGILINFGDVLILKDEHLGEVAINPEKITAVQLLSEGPTLQTSPMGE